VLEVQVSVALAGAVPATAAQLGDLGAALRARRAPLRGLALRGARQGSAGLEATLGALAAAQARAVPRHPVGPFPTQRAVL